MMKSARPTRLYPAIVLQGLAFAGATTGCGGTETGTIDPNTPPNFSWRFDAGADAGLGGGTPAVDAGDNPVRDAGTTARDAGTPLRDAGTFARDAGAPVHDAGAAVDAGWAPTK